MTIPSTGQTAKVIRSACVSRGTVPIIGRVPAQTSRGLSTAAPRSSRTDRPDRTNDRTAAAPVSRRTGRLCELREIALDRRRLRHPAQVSKPQLAAHLSDCGDWADVVRLLRRAVGPLAPVGESRTARSGGGHALTAGFPRRTYARGGDGDRPH